MRASISRSGAGWTGRISCTTRGERVPLAWNTHRMRARDLRQGVLQVRHQPFEDRFVERQQGYRYPCNGSPGRDDGSSLSADATLNSMTDCLTFVDRLRPGYPPHSTRSSSKSGTRFAMTV